MPRPRRRACLESGLKLDLNRLARQGFVRPGGRTGPTSICWTYTYTNERIASGKISANMENPGAGFFRIRIGSLDQSIVLRAYAVSRVSGEAGAAGGFTVSASRPAAVGNRGPNLEKTDRDSGRRTAYVAARLPPGGPN